MAGLPTDRRDNSSINQATMPLGDWWVDDEGRWRAGGYLSMIFPADSESMRREGECGAIFHLGMANLLVQPHRITIRWSVRHMERGSLMAIREFLEGLINPPRIVLEYFYGGWERRYFSNPELAIECLNSAMGYQDAVPMVKPFVRRMPLDSNVMALEGIRNVFAAWDRSGGRLLAGGDNPLAPYEQRFLVFAPTSNDNGIVYRSLGSQAALTRFKGLRWAASVAGKSYGRGVENDAYSDVLTGPYSQVLTSEEPRLDHVRACITRAGQDPEWVTYQRLLLPAVDRVDHPLVLCLAARTSMVNIPLQVRTA